MASGKIKGGTTTSGVVTKGLITTGTISSGSQAIGGNINIPSAGVATYIGAETDTAIINVDNGNFIISANVKIDNVVVEEKEARESKDEKLEEKINSLDSSLSSHITDKDNPHQVTKAQIGLENDWKAATKWSSLASHIVGV